MIRSVQLNIAQANKKDEFYTQLKDIEKELVYYKEHFRKKIVYCNCDDPRVSNFAVFFKNHFKEFGLRKLICSCCNNDMLDAKDIGSATYMEYVGTKASETILKLCGDGDFRSRECLDFLRKADIIVTNPPFSLFRDFISKIVEYDKKFLIIGNVNAISYKECFQLMKENKMWLGQSIHSGDREFRVSDDYPLNAANSRVDLFGNKFVRVKGVRWFTNLNYEGRYQELKLTKHYVPEYYPKFDNFDAISVAKTSEIPIDYFGIMGVPITYLDKFNPKQFEIVGNEYTLNIVGGRAYLNGKRMYSRIFIRRIKTNFENLNNDIVNKPLLDFKEESKVMNF